MSRHCLLGLAAIFLTLIGAAGCGGGVPEPGSQAIQPANYKEREKEISDGFKAMMKEQQAAKQKKAG